MTQTGKNGSFDITIMRVLPGEHDKSNTYLSLFDEHCLFVCTSLKETVQNVSHGTSYTYKFPKKRFVHQLNMRGVLFRYLV